MADTDQIDAGPIAGNVLFYSKPEPLSKELHGKLGLRRIDRPFAFAAGSQVAPLTVAEFPVAGLSFPIIFAGERHQPLAVMGVDADANMFIEPTGGFEPGVYIPAYIRRYPFVLANDPKGEQLVVCIDRAAPMLGDLPDLPFFDAQGEPTEYTKNCLQFCNDFEVEVRRTQSFVNLMTELDLFETRTQTYTPTNSDGSPGAPQTVAEYFAISEAKLKALPPEKLQELLANGAVGQIYAHLMSLLGWDRLMALAIARQAASPRAANLN
ncbi:MAG: SapC family protein [Caulobacteraceae bacterium]